MTEIRYPYPDPPAEGQALSVAPGILWIRLPLPMALDHVNVYALEDPDGWTLIDCGIYSPQMLALWQKLLAGPLAGKPVKRLILTHHHPDHIGMAGWFIERGAELVMHRTAWLYARMQILDVQDRPSTPQLLFWQRAGMPAPERRRRAREVPFNFIDWCHPLPPGFTRLVEGQVLEMAGRRWVTRFGHGHAPWHATFWSEGLVLGGDQLLPSISANIGVYATEPEADPLADWIESCQRLSAYADAGQLVLPGHKLPFTGLPLRIQQLEANHHGALARLRALLAAPQTAVSCFPALFKRAIGGAEFGLALAESVAHLNHLLHLGEVTRELGPEGEWLWQNRAM